MEPCVLELQTSGIEGLGEQTENLPFKHWWPIKMLKKKNKQVFVSERRGIHAHGHQRNKAEGEGVSGRGKWYL